MQELSQIPCFNIARPLMMRLDTLHLPTKHFILLMVVHALFFSLFLSLPTCPALPFVGAGAGTGAAESATSLDRSSKAGGMDFHGRPQVTVVVALKLNRSYSGGRGTGGLGGKE